MARRLLDTTFARLRTPSVWGLLGVVVIFFAAGSLNLWSMPLLEPNDEGRHMGYAMALAEGRIPHVLEPIDLVGTKIGYLRGTNIQAAAAHPPLYHALVALPLKASANADEIAWGILFARMLSLAFGIASVLYAYRLVRLLLPRREDLALASAAIVACFPVYVASSSIGYGDSLGALAFVATLASCVEYATLGHTWRRYFLACAWFSAASLTRLPVLVAASPAILALGIPRLVDTQGPLPRRLARAIVPILGPALCAIAAAGWFYAMNIMRYGDPSATNALLTRLERQSTPILEVIFSRDWQRLFEFQWAAIVGMVRKNTLATHFSRSILYLALLGGIIHAVRLVRGGRPTTRAPRELWMARVIVAVCVLACVGLLFVFRARGGQMTARYAMPFAWAIALGLASLLAWTKRPGQLQAVLAGFVGFLFLTLEHYAPEEQLSFGETRLAAALKDQGVPYPDTFLFLHVVLLVVGGVLVAKAVGLLYRPAQAVSVLHAEPEAPALSSSPAPIREPAGGDGEVRA